MFDFDDRKTQWLDARARSIEMDGVMKLQSSEIICAWHNTQFSFKQWRYNVAEASKYRLTCNMPRHCFTPMSWSHGSLSNMLNEGNYIITSFAHLASETGRWCGRSSSPGHAVEGWGYIPGSWRDAARVYRITCWRKGAWWPWQMQTAWNPDQPAPHYHRIPVSCPVKLKRDLTSQRVYGLTPCMEPYRRGKFCNY